MHPGDEYVLLLIQDKPLYSSDSFTSFLGNLAQTLQVIMTMKLQVILHQTRLWKQFNYGALL